MCVKQGWHFLFPFTTRFCVTQKKNFLKIRHLLNSHEEGPAVPPLGWSPPGAHRSVLWGRLLGEGGCYCALQFYGDVGGGAAAGLKGESWSSGFSSLALVRGLPHLLWVSLEPLK